MDYYVRLERGRGPNASEAVLDAIARALRLDDTERGHLFALARPTRTRRRPMPPQRVRPGLYRVLDTLTENPALVLGHRRDVLATNRLARALYTDFDALPHRERNMARFIFLNDAPHGRRRPHRTSCGTGWTRRRVARVRCQAEVSAASACRGFQRRMTVSSVSSWTWPARSRSIQCSDWRRRTGRPVTAAEGEGV